MVQNFIILLGKNTLVSVGLTIPIHRYKKVTVHGLKSASASFYIHASKNLEIIIQHRSKIDT
jgi:peptide deformylase